MHPLHTDVLHEISLRLSLVDVASLWLCGCKRLQTKLQQAVTELSLDWREPAFFRMPPLVSYFPHLTCLALVNGSDIEDWPMDAGIGLSCISERLQTLKLVCYDPSSFFVALPSSGATFLDFEQCFPSLIEVSLSGSYFHPDFWMCKWPRSVEKFELSVRDFCVHSNFCRSNWIPLAHTRS